MSTSTQSFTGLKASLAKIPPAVRESHNGQRWYRPQHIEGHLVPSVTTILGSLRSKGLEEWRESVGKTKADDIARAAAQRGDVLHHALEVWWETKDLHKVQLQLQKDKDEYPLKPWETGKSMWWAMWHNGPLHEPLHSLGMETQLWHPQFAGTVDFPAWHEEQPHFRVIDFKSATTPKSNPVKYFLQLAAYRRLLYWNTGAIAKQAECWIQTRDQGFQRFVLTGDDLKLWDNRWIKLVNKWWSEQ